MYNLPQRLLVANPINRYLLNTPMMPNWVKDADGGYTFYIQNESPGKDKEANWLPAPKGGSTWSCASTCPSKEAQDGIWKAPKPTKSVAGGSRRSGEEMCWTMDARSTRSRRFCMSGHDMS